MMQQIISIASEEIKYVAACSQHLFSGKNRPLHKVLVNGTPKTGTTWVLRMISSLPGYRIAPGYNFRGEIERYHELTPGDVVHGHDPFSESLWEILNENEIKVVLTIRDPRDQTVSRVFHVRRDTQHNWHQKAKKMTDDELLMACIEGGKNGLPDVVTSLGVTLTWLAAKNNALCLKYENLLANPEKELQKTLHYIENKASDRLIHAVVEKNSFKRLSAGRKFWKADRKRGQQEVSSHYRKGIRGDWRNHFKESHKQKFKELAGQILIDLNYERDFDW